jgi:hypothetical protein
LNRERILASRPAERNARVQFAAPAGVHLRAAAARVGRA